MMCLSVAVTSNESVAEQLPEPAMIMLPSEDVDCGFGKRRKMSKTDSPNSSCFDVAQLLESIHDEVNGEDVTPQCKQVSIPFVEKLNFVSFGGDDFDFIDIPETPNPETTPQPPVFKRGSLGKRSRGLGRSQTIKMGLCNLVETE
jgi:hypothetical protein